MEPRGMEDKWIYIKAGDFVMKFRFDNKCPLTCYCTAQTVDYVLFTYVLLDFVGSLRKCCTDCFKNALEAANGVWFITPEEGRPYFDD